MANEDVVRINKTKSLQKYINEFKTTTNQRRKDDIARFLMDIDTIDDPIMDKATVKRKKSLCDFYIRNAHTEKTRRYWKNRKRRLKRGK